MFIYCKLFSSFENKLLLNEIKQTDIVFIEDKKTIWTHGVFFTPEINSEDIENIIQSSEELKTFFKSLTPSEIAISSTEPINDEKLWIDTSE